MPNLVLRRSVLTPAEDQLVATAAAFAQGHFSDPAQKMALPGYRDLLQQACKAGLAGIEVPASMGGAGASYAALVRVCETLAPFNAGFAFSLVNHHNVTARIAQAGTPELRARWLDSMLDGSRIGCTAMTEPQSGSDFTSVRTTATRSRGGWVLNGAKAWITNVAHAAVLLIYAQTDPAAGAKGIGGFLVESNAAGFERGRSYTGLGTEGTGVGEFRLHDCQVARDGLLYPPGQGFRFAMRGVNRARTYVAAMDAAMLDMALQTACRYAESRHTFGQPLLSFQGMGWSLANVATLLQAMYLLVDASTQAIVGQHDAQGIAAMAKKYANDHTGSALAACMQALGAQGLLPEYRLDRYVAWARAFCYADGTPEMMNERIVHLLRKPYRNLERRS